MAEETKQNPKPEQIRASEIEPICLGTAILLCCLARRECGLTSGRRTYYNETHGSGKRSIEDTV